MFRRKESFVVDCFLDVGHDVVDVLWSRQFALLSLFINPHVNSLSRTRLRRGTEMEESRGEDVNEDPLARFDIEDNCKDEESRQKNSKELPCPDKWRGCRTQTQFRREG